MCVDSWGESACMVVEARGVKKSATRRRLSQTHLAPRIFGNESDTIDSFRQSAELMGLSLRQIVALKQQVHKPREAGLLVRHICSSQLPPFHLPSPSSFPT